MAAEQQTSITIGANTQPFTDGLKTASSAAQQFGSQIDKLSATTVQTTQQVTMTAGAFQKLAASLDPAVRSAQNFASAQQKIQQAVSSGLSSQEQANRLLDLAAEKYNVVSKSQLDAAKSTQQQVEQYKLLGTVLGPILQKTQQLTEVQKALNVQVKANTITPAQATQLYNTAKQYGGPPAPQVPNLPNAPPGEAANAMKLTSQQLFVFEAQIRQFADQVMAGGGIFRPLAMQAPVAIEALGGVSKALTLIKNNAASIVGFGGIAAVAVALGLIAVAAERSQRAINDLAISLQKYGGNFQQNAATVNAAAKQLAETTSLTTQESREAILKLAETPGFKMTKDNMVEVTKGLHDFAESFGTTLPEAAAAFKSTFADPVATAIKYAQQGIEGFDQSFTETVRNIQQQSGQAAAGAAVWDKLTASVKKAENEGTDLQKAWKKLMEALTATGNSAGGASQGIGVTLVNALTGMINAATKLVPLINDIGTALTKLSDGLKAIGIGADAQSALFAAAFLQMLSPVRNLELALGKIFLMKIPGWFANLAAGGVAGAAEGVAARAAGTAVAAAAGGAAVGGVEAVGATALFAALGGAAGVAALAVLVIGASAAVIWATMKAGATANLAEQEFQTGAAAAGFQRYQPSSYELPRYMNTRTGEDLSTEEMHQRVLGQTLADSFGTRLDTWFGTHMPGGLGGRGNPLEQLVAQPQPGTQILKPLTNIPAAGQQYAPLFAQSEAKYGLPPGLLAGIASIETGGTFNQNAVNKESGASGLMQLLLSTAQKPGYGVTPLTDEERRDPAKSIDFAGQYLAKVALAHGGDLAAAVKQYSGGEGQAGYLLDPSLKYTLKPPQEVTKPPEPKLPVAPQTVDQQVQAVLSGTSAKSPDALAAGQARSTDQLKALTQGYLDYIEGLKKAATEAGVSSESIKALNKVEEEQRAKLESLKTPLEKTTEANQQQLKVLQELDPVEQKVAEAIQAVENANRAAGLAALSDAQKQQIKIDTLNQLAAQYMQTINAAKAEADSQERLAAAYDKGTAAVLHQTNAEQARQAISGNALTQSAAAKAATALETAELDRKTAALQKVQLAQMKQQDEAANRLLDAQQSTVHSSALAQAQATAAAQTINQLKQAGIDENSSQGQKAMQDASTTAARTVNVQREKQAWTEVDNAASQAIDDMGDGLNSFLSTGKWSDFGSAAKKALSDITSELIKMAVLNPIKNLLGIGGGNNASIFDLFNNTGGAAASNAGGAVGSGGMFGGGGGGGGSGLGALGGLGGMLAGAFGKTGLFGSEGLLFGSGAGAAAGAAGASSIGTFGFAEILNSSNAAVSSMGLNLLAGDATAAAAALPAATASEAFLAGGLYHEGGIVGHGGTFRVLPASAFIGAPHFAQGGVAMPLRFRKGMPNKFNHGDNFAMDTLPPFGNDEVPAILHRGERVLTPQQQRDAAAQAGRSNRPVYIQPTFNISTPDADSFRKSKSQINAELVRAMTSATRKI